MNSSLILIFNCFLSVHSISNVQHMTGTLTKYANTVEVKLVEDKQNQVVNGTPHTLTLVQFRIKTQMKHGIVEKMACH